VLTQRTRRRGRVLGARGHRQDLVQAWQQLLQRARAAATMWPLLLSWKRQTPVSSKLTWALHTLGERDVPPTHTYAAVRQEAEDLWNSHCKNTPRMQKAALAAEREELRRHAQDEAQREEPLRRG
jgi:hypothetical protein